MVRRPALLGEDNAGEGRIWFAMLGCRSGGTNTNPPKKSTTTYT
jgi:hypothetical protein